jgi:hypothetical protein
MIIKYNKHFKMSDIEYDYEYDYIGYEEYEKEKFIRWFYGKINLDEYDKELEISFEQEEERRWYYGYEKDY